MLNGLDTGSTPVRSTSKNSLTGHMELISCMVDIKRQEVVTSLVDASFEESLDLWNEAYHLVYSEVCE